MAGWGGVGPNALPFATLQPLGVVLPSQPFLHSVSMWFITELDDSSLSILRQIETVIGRQIIVFVFGLFRLMSQPYNY